MNHTLTASPHAHAPTSIGRTMGLVMLGPHGRGSEDLLRQRLDDESPLVRVAAAEGLFGLGEVEAARAALVQALHHETPFVRLRAMNVLYRMGADARPALAAIQQASMNGIFPADYLNRMTEYLPARLEQ